MFNFFGGTLLTGPSTYTGLNNTASSFSSMGNIMGVMGAITGAIGSYYQAKTQQYQLKSQASSLQFQADISRMNKRAAEFTAQNIMQAGERQAGAVSMKYGQMRGTARARMAASGGVIGVGSSKEALATTDLMKEIDMLTINANTVRAAESARTQGVNYGLQATMQSVSANNMLASAKTISPFMAAGTSLLGSAQSLMGSWYQDRQIAALARRIGMDPYAPMEY